MCLLVVATIFLCLFSRHRRRVSTHSYHRDLIRLWVVFFAITLSALSFILGVSLSGAATVSNPLSLLPILYVVLVFHGAEVIIISFAFLCTKKVIEFYRDLFTCTSRNNKPAANPGFGVEPPDAGCVSLSSRNAHVGADVEMPTRETASEGEIPTGEVETPTGEEGEAFIGVVEEGEASGGDRETSQERRESGSDREVVDSN